MKTMVDEVAVFNRVDGDHKVVETWVEMPHHAEILGMVPASGGFRVIVKYTYSDGESPTLKRVPIELVQGWGDLKDPGARYLGSHRFSKSDGPNWHIFLPTQKD